MTEHRDPMKPWFAVWLIDNTDGTLDPTNSVPDHFDGLDEALSFAKRELEKLQGGRYVVCAIEPQWIVSPVAQISPISEDVVVVEEEEVDG